MQKAFKKAHNKGVLSNFSKIYCSNNKDCLSPLFDLSNTKKLKPPYFRGFFNMFYKQKLNEYRNAKFFL